MKINQNSAAPPADAWTDVLKLFTEIVDSEDPPVPRCPIAERGAGPARMPHWSGFLRQKLRSARTESSGT